MHERVVVMGKGVLAIRIAEWFSSSPEYRLIRIVPVIPEPDWTSSFVAWGRARGVPVVETGNYRDLLRYGCDRDHLDFVFSVFYDRRIKPDFIARCKRILNLHNAPLPRYRGVSPINWTLKNGEAKHGVTIHEVVEGIDSGPVVAQLEYSIYPEFDEVVDVYRRAIEYGWALFQQTMPLLDRITPRPQLESQASYYSKKDEALLGDRREFTRAVYSPHAG